MKKIFSLLLLPLMIVAACQNKEQPTRRKTEDDVIVDNNKSYKEITKWESSIFYEINYENLQFHIVWNEFVNGQYTGETREWFVFLTGFYMIEDYHKNNYFYECLKSNNSYDYYLIAQY